MIHILQLINEVNKNKVLYGIVYSLRFLFEMINCHLI